MNRQSQQRRRQRGGVLVQVLLVLLGLTVLMATLVSNQHVALNTTQNTLRERRAEVAARSALALALATLQSADVNLVTKNDDWATLGNNGLDVTELGDATYRLEIIDAASRINVNLATEPQLQKLPMTDEQLTALLDWRDPATQPRSNGAKDEYYNTLTTPYNTKLAKLTTLSELLLIKGWTARGLYQAQTDELQSTALVLQDDAGVDLPLANLLVTDGAAPNTRVDGSTRININVANLNANVLTQFGINQAQAQLLILQGPFTSFAQILTQPGVTTDAAQQLLDGATFTATPRLEGKININTASDAVLQTIPNVTTDISSAIVERQSAGFASLGELATIPGVSGTTLASLADAVGVGSDTWIVRAYGESGGVGVAIEAVVGIRSSNARVLTYERLTTASVPTWWNWGEDTTVTTTIGATK